MKSIKCFLLILFAITSIYPLTAFATETRLNSMGGINLYTRDNSDIFTFPGTISQYTGQAVGELRAKNDDTEYSIGFLSETESIGIFGVYLNNPINQYYLDMGDNMNYIDNITLNRSVDVFYGKKLSNFNFGLRGSVAIDRWSQEDANGDEYKETAHLFSVAAGLSNELFDVSAKLDFPGYKSEVIKDEESISAIGLGLNGRMYFGDKEKFEIIPVGQLYIGPGSYEDGISAVKKIKYDINQFNLSLGVGCNYHVDKNNLLVFGVKGVSYDNFSVDKKNIGKESYSTLILPGFYFGIESQIKPWLTGRFGGSQIYQSNKITDKPTGQKESSLTTFDDDFALTFGLALHFGDFTLDALVDEGLLFDGPNFISGTNEVMSTQLSLLYNF